MGKSGYRIDFDWQIGEDLYNVEVRGYPDEWYIEGIERYNNANRTEVVGEEKAKELEELLDRDTEFSLIVEERLIDERVGKLEALRDEEIERKIDDHLMNKAWRKIDDNQK